MSHVESGSVTGSALAGSVSGGGSGASSNGHHKKLRRKKKELDALVPEDKVRRKSSSASHHDLLHSDSDEGEAEFSGRRGKSGVLFTHGGLLGVLPGACTLLVLLTTVVGVVATLKLLMVTRRDLDALHLRLNAVEASGSELPAKFHESHVRLQQLEKNQTSLWTTLNVLSTDFQDVVKKVEDMQGSIKSLQDSISGAPQLTTLPKDVAALQDSIATFGSSLQDAQSSLKAVKEQQEKVQKQLKHTLGNITDMKSEMKTLKANTNVPLRTREENGKEESVAAAVVSLQNHLNRLSLDISSFNSSFAATMKEQRDKLMESEDNEMMVNSSLINITRKIENFESSHENNLTCLTNITKELTQLEVEVDNIQRKLMNVTRNVDIVKGVERKLEGSQVQMASGMSEIKQQLQKLERKINFLTPLTTNSATSSPTSTP